MTTKRSTKTARRSLRRMVRPLGGYVQLHAGTHSDGRNLWHSDDEGKTYWRGNWGKCTPAQLLNECVTTMRDLLVQHPDLVRSNARMRDGVQR